MIRVRPPLLKLPGLVVARGLLEDDVQSVEGVRLVAHYRHAKRLPAIYIAMRSEAYVGRVAGLAVALGATPPW